MTSMCSVEGCSKEGVFEANGVKKDLPIKPNPTGKTPKTLRLCLEHMADGTPPVTPTSSTPRASARRSSVHGPEDGEEGLEVVEEEDGAPGQWGEEGGPNKVGCASRSFLYLFLPSRYCSPALVRH
jgi:hypothetical protein